MAGTCTRTQVDEAASALPGSKPYQRCIDAYAQYLGLESTNEIVLAAGSQAVIHALPKMLNPGSATILGPTYSEHARSWRLTGHRVEERSFSNIPAKEVTADTALILTNPNNPDGRRVDRETVLALAQRQSASGGFLIVDEAFADIAPEVSIAASGLPPGVFVLRSFGKFFGLAGIRLGCVRSAEPYSSDLREALGAWPVNGLALRIAFKALSDTTWIEETCEKLEGSGERLNRVLAQTGAKVVGGTSLFCLIEHADAATIFTKLATHGIYVRCFADHPHRLRFGLPGPEEAWQRLETALEEIGK